MNGVINFFVYDVVIGLHILDLVEKVNDKIAEGWVTVGGFSAWETTTGVFPFYSKEMRFSQAMRRTTKRAADLRLPSRRKNKVASGASR